MGPQRSPQTPGGSDPEGSLFVLLFLKKVAVNLRIVIKKKQQ